MVCSTSTISPEAAVAEIVAFAISWFRRCSKVCSINSAARTAACGGGLTEGAGGRLDLRLKLASIPSHAGVPRHRSCRSNVGIVTGHRPSRRSRRRLSVKPNPQQSVILLSVAPLSSLFTLVELDLAGTRDRSRMPSPERRTVPWPRLPSPTASTPCAASHLTVCPMVATFLDVTRIETRARTPAPISRPMLPTRASKDVRIGTVQREFDPVKGLPRAGCVKGEHAACAEQCARAALANSRAELEDF